MKVILAFIVLTSFNLFTPAAPSLAAHHSPWRCSICGAPHGNLIGNGVCLDCNKREFGIRPNGGGTVAAPVRVRR